MKNRIGEPVPLIWFIAIAALIVMFMYSIAEAQNPDLFQSNDMNTQTSGDVQTGKSIVIGFGMGDVDINDCMYTKSTPFFQWGKYNKSCLADGYDRRGQHDNAARMRCSIKIVNNMYKSNTHCIVMNTLKAVSKSAPALTVIHNDNDDDDDDHRRRDEQIEQLTTQLEQYGQQQQRAAQQAHRQQQIQREQYNRVQQYEETRQKKLDLIKNVFGDNGAQ